MFAARCIGVSLAVFVLLYVFLSLLVSRGWKLMRRTLQPSLGSWRCRFAVYSACSSTRHICVCDLRIYSAVFFVAGASLDWRGDWHGSVGARNLLFGSARCGRLSAPRWLSCGHRERWLRWLNGSALMEPQIKESGTDVPIFRIGNDAPTLTVAGVCAPKVLVSEAAIAALTSRELRTALRHEIAHAIRYDNLRKLLFRFSVFPAMAELEHAWSEETEMAADDAAVSSFHDALDLAAALIKVSRLGPVEFSGELTMALLHSSTALSARVHRLVAWDQATKATKPWKMVLRCAGGSRDPHCCSDDVRLSAHSNARRDRVAGALRSTSRCAVALHSYTRCHPERSEGSGFCR